MAVSDLVRGVGRTVFGTAVAGFGLSLGRDVYKRAKRTAGNSFAALLIGFLILVALCGAIYLPYKAASKLIDWYPNVMQWFFFALIPWGVLGFIGLVLAYYVGEIAYYGLVYELPSHIDAEAEPALAMTTFENSGAYNSFIAWLSGYLVVVCGTGFVVGGRRRDVRRRAYAAQQYNQSFLNKIGIKEVDGAASYTHVDAQGNQLRLTSIGKDIVEFFVVGRRNKRAFIKVGADGKFTTYSGVVNVG